MKQLRVLVVLFVLVVCAAVEASAQTVYITRTGAKYHRDGCRYLSQSKIPISLNEAKRNGYGACKVCRPPGIIENENDNQETTLTSDIPVHTAAPGVSNDSAPAKRTEKDSSVLIKKNIKKNEYGTI